MHLFLRKSWPALIVMSLAIVQVRRQANPWTIDTLCLCVAAVGMLMNLTVILANGAMPVAAAEEEIPDAERGSYRPIDSRTRLAFLADWIDLGWAYYSPGDLVVDFAALGLIANAAWIWLF